MEKVQLRAGRRVGTTMAAALVTSAALLGWAAPAHAAGSITSPGADEVISTEGVVEIRAVVERGSAERTDLRLAGPTETQWQVVDSAPAGTRSELSYALFTECSTYPSGPCHERDPLRNGEWTISLAGGAEDERTFLVRIPPRTPEQVTMARKGELVVATWLRGPEPDLTGWTLYGGDNKPVKSVGLAACDGAECRLQLRSSAAASYSLIASRATCPDCPEVVDSPHSKRFSVPAGPPPGEGGDAGDDELTMGSGTASGPSSAGGGSSNLDQRAAFARAFRQGAAGLGMPPAGAEGSAPQVAPLLPDGTYGTSLPYADAAPGGSAEVPSRATGARIGTPDRSLQLAGSAVLIALAVALHHLARRRLVPTDETGSY
ncbi:MAG TPA: hypothetical protein VNA30_05910 [Mycobacteriales bacterium]|nr:hypothetical protein [Mycobacteriales bacterium]